MDLIRFMSAPRSSSLGFMQSSSSSSRDATITLAGFLSYSPRETLAATARANQLLASPGSPSISVILPRGIYGYHRYSTSLISTSSIFISAGCSIIAFSVEYIDSMVVLSSFSSIGGLFFRFHADNASQISSWARPLPAHLPVSLVAVSFLSPSPTPSSALIYQESSSLDDDDFLFLLSSISHLGAGAIFSSFRALYLFWLEYRLGGIII